ncbi:hypothetical protein [Natronoglycomyces albus]|uniref:Uncharacterized protein n=1 Tax=Natronoglycomyces albus TaxID=2811108 RepID=A0A895XQ31_9ACTN|nr:hypothetical protein [Natronoglycomyces albus]QSB05479.1 hypothetical protein JQS30_00600 [Natronoglycomyces albus]
MSAFDDYLTAVRELDTMRRNQAETEQQRAGQAATLGEQANAIDAQVADQRNAITALAAEAKTTVELKGPIVTPGQDPRSELAAASADLERSHQTLAQARWLAHRPPALPAWRVDERNGLIYGLWAVVAIVAQLIVLRTSGTPDGIWQVVTLSAWLVGLPLAAFAAGWLSIGVVSRPRLGEPEKLQRNPRLGLVICASTLVVACGLFW